MSLTFLEIQQQFSQLRDASVRHRDIANRLNISEAELIAAHVGQDNQSQRLSVTRLNTQWPNMIAAVNRLGKVMALTRNEACVHEKIGQYENISCEGGHVGLVLGGPIDLRVFYHSWSSGFAVVEKHDAKTQHSLQFFDKTGTAIHKIYLKEAKEAEFFQFASEFAAEEQTPALTLVSAASLVVTEKPDADIDVAGLTRHGSLRRYP
jgi:putative hemin transport protein